MHGFETRMDFDNPNRILLVRYNIMKRKVVAVFVAVCMIVCIASYSALAYANSVPYSVNGPTHKVTLTNGSGSGKLLSTKATMTAGNGGVWVQVRNSTGSYVLKKKLFPFYDQSVGPLTYTVNSGTTVRLYVAPNVSGQTVTGTLYYDF